jgi:hypothetical protein
VIDRESPFAAKQRGFLVGEMGKRSEVVWFFIEQREV